MSKKGKYSPHIFDWNEIKISDDEYIVLRHDKYETVNKKKLRKLKIEDILKEENDV
jgi:hypothetical protein